MNPPTRVQLATWVKEAWDMVPTELMKNSFLVCGISNAIDQGWAIVSACGPHRGHGS